MAAAYVNNVNGPRSTDTS